MRERAAVEVQYSKSLQVIAKKAEKLLQQHMGGAVMGDTPSKGVTEDVVNRSTLHTALSSLVDALDRTAQEHMSFSEVLSIQVADDLKALAKKKEETRKKHSSFYAKLVNDRDAVYNGRIKAQSKYYSHCEEFESSRQKQERAGDDKHAQRAAKQAEDSQTSMLDAKNTYLIGISVSNRAKEKFYESSVHEIENQYQLLQTSITSRLSYILSNYCAFTSSHLSTLTSTVNGLQTKIQEIDYVADDELFVELNRRPFTIPNDWAFEPCPTFYDTPEISLEPEPKVLLQNKLARAQGKLAENRPIQKAKDAEANRLRDLSVKYADDPNLGSADTALDDAFEAFHAASQLDLACAVYEEEVQVISEAVGGDVGGQAPHMFKDASFAVPTTCGFCQSSIWGLSKQGKTCKKCGLCVHAKCELKVPAECRGTKEGGTPTVARMKSSATKGHAAKLSVSTVPSSSSSSLQKTPSTMSSASSHSFAKSQGAFITSASGSEPDGTVVFDFTASSTFELTASAGTPVWLVDGDDGSGWMKVSDGTKEGLVPSAYLKITAPAASGTTKKAKPPPPPGRGTRPGKKVRALYDYAPQGDDELSLTVGCTVTLTPTGDAYAEGWYEGVDSQGKQGVFPSNYVEMV
ncbi:hypothetical protein DL93DRAFT_2075793 [Clavulina sp. PMI_390]|nr:hypothetical protein DL93DRAFT_2075793 [Clavulina sp. PMI_390]